MSYTASETYLELLQRAHLRGLVDRRTVEQVADSGSWWEAYACLEHGGQDAGRTAYPWPKGSPRWDPLKAAQKAEQDRAQPAIAKLTQLQDAMPYGYLETGHAVLTVPQEGQENIDPRDPDDVKTLKAAARTLLEDLWDRLGLPGTPPVYARVHPASSSRPHESTPHVHATLVGLARLEGSSAIREAELEGRPHVDTVKRGRGSGHPVQVDVDGEPVPVVYAAAKGKKAGQPSELHLTDEDLAWLYQRWGQLLEQAFDVEPARLDDPRAPIDVPLEGADVNWAYKRLDPHDDEHGLGHVKHRLRYDTRAWLQDVHKVLQTVSDTHVYLKAPDALTGELVELEAFLEGFTWWATRPSRLHLGSWYGPLADCIKGRTWAELGLQEEADQDDDEDAHACPVENCQETMHGLGRELELGEAQRFLEHGELPRDVVHTFWPHMAEGFREAQRHGPDEMPTPNKDRPPPKEASAA